MSKKEEKSERKKGIKHPLLVYRFIAHRYRPAGVLLFLMGLLALLPTAIPALRYKTSFISYTQLASVGIAALVAGAGIWILSIFIERRAYVQCYPDYLVINTSARRVAVAYQRFVSIQPVQVNQVFPLEEIKGRDRDYIRHLRAETALEIEISDFPIPEKKLRRSINCFVFSPREKGFIFIVPNETRLNLEIGTFSQHALDRRDESQQRYQDPIERLRYQQPTKMF